MNESNMSYSTHTRASGHDTDAQPLNQPISGGA